MHSPPDAPVARTNLAKCIQLLDELSIVWNSAGRQRDLLAGLVNLAEPSMTVNPESPHGQKRTATSAGIVEEPAGPSQHPPYTSPEPFQFGQSNIFGQTGFDFTAPSLPDLHAAPFPDLFNFMTSNTGVRRILELQMSDLSLRSFLDGYDAATGTLVRPARWRVFRRLVAVFGWTASSTASISTHVRTRLDGGNLCWAF